jgi:hypothetical protein
MIGIHLEIPWLHITMHLTHADPYPRPLTWLHAHLPQQASPRMHALLLPTATQYHLQFKPVLGSSPWSTVASNTPGPQCEARQCAAEQCHASQSKQAAGTCHHFSHVPTKTAIPTAQHTHTSGNVRCPQSDACFSRPGQHCSRGGR